jgi:hypothetical protein
MKKVKLVIAAVAMLGLVSGSAAYAAGFAPGEGLYIGGFAAGTTGIVQPTVTTTAGTGAAAGGSEAGGTFQATDGGLGMIGIEGGGWLGYGFKMGDVYGGIEGEMSAGDVQFRLTSATGIDIGSGSGNEAQDVTEVQATKDWTGGMFGRIGLYLNPNTLLSFKGGVLVSKFDVSYTGQSETFYGGGPSFGLDLESTVSAIDDNLNVRLGAVYTQSLKQVLS